MFSLRSNLACPAGPISLSLVQPHSLRSPNPAKATIMVDTQSRKPKGGRPKSDPATVRTMTIGVRVSSTEYAQLAERAAAMHMKPAQWLREAALSRRLPPPPVAAINREQYAELARLAANLNQLTRLANEGQRVTIADALLKQLQAETQRLRLVLLGVKDNVDDR